jgi:hypothetical protein
MTQSQNPPERPRVEPEIIPPDRTGRKSDWRQREWRPYGYASGTQRIYVGGIGPLGIAILILLVGVVVAVGLLAIIGAVLFWIPVLALLVAAGALFRFLRR